MRKEEVCGATFADASSVATGSGLRDDEWEWCPDCADVQQEGLGYD